MAAQSKFGYRLVLITLTAGLLLLGLAGYLPRKPNQSTDSLVAIKQADVVVLSSNPPKLIGQHGDQINYQTRLDMSPIHYGVGGDKLVLVGHDSVAVLNIKTGELLAKKPLNLKVMAYKQGLVESVFVDPLSAKGYFLCTDSQDLSNPRLAVLDLVNFSLELMPLPGIFAHKVIPIGNDLGFCATGTVYRFTKPPLQQRNGFSGSQEQNGLSYQFLQNSGLYSLDSKSGLVLHLADQELRPLPAPVSHRLAGQRLGDRLIALDDAANGVISASSTAEGTTLQSFDIVKASRLWEKKITGQVDQLLLSENQQVLLLDRSRNQLSKLDPKTLELTGFRTFGNDCTLLWAR